MNMSFSLFYIRMRSRSYEGWWKCLIDINYRENTNLNMKNKDNFICEILCVPL